MNRKRQNNQQELALEPKDRGEAPARGDEETEPFMAKSATENPAFTEQLMEEVCDRENLERAWKRVKRNKGSPGVDGMTIDDAKAFLRQHWPNIRSQLLDGNYRPQPVKRVEIPKPDGGVRKLGVPCVVDRLIQQARAASSPRAMGSDVFGAQFRISAGAVRPPGCSPGTALRRRWLQRSG